MMNLRHVTVSTARQRRRRRRRSTRTVNSRKSITKDIVICFSTCIFVVAVSIVVHVHGITFLAKTKETFRLAELHHLEAQILTLQRQKIKSKPAMPTLPPSQTTTATTRNRHCEIDLLLVDQSTGSSLFRLQSTVATTKQHIMETGERNDDDRNIDDNEDGRDDVDLLSLLPYDIRTSSFLRHRCDWIGHVLVEGQNASEFIHQINDGTSSNITDGWSLDYVQMQHAQRSNSNHDATDIEHEPSDSIQINSKNDDRQEQQRRRQKPNKKSILSAVANVVPSRPTLYPKEALTNLLVVDCAPDEETSSASSASTGYYLVRILDHCRPDKTNDLAINKSNSTPTTDVGSSDAPLHHDDRHLLLPSLRKDVWSRRPFQYSSAINFEIAEAIVDILLSTTLKNEENVAKPKLRLLDPTCGSGTLLAVALSKGFHSVEGYDINPSCVEGTIRNLDYVFGTDIVKAKAHVAMRDSSVEWTLATKDNIATTTNKSDSDLIDFPATVSFVVANLPWGQNSILYVNENRRILNAIRRRVSEGTLCVVVTRPDSHNDIGRSWDGTGFCEIGNAYVPQRDLVAREGKKSKKKKRSMTGTNVSMGPSPDPARCLISVLVAK